MAKHISSELSTSVLQFKRGGFPPSFVLTAYNESDRLASFQLDLLTAKSDNHHTHWYRLEPAVSSKIPPGDSTRFRVDILEVPPVTQGFNGTMNLTARVYSPELRDEDRLDLLLMVEGDSLLPIQMTLPDRTFKAHPDERVEMTVKLLNPNRKMAEVRVQIRDLPSAWFPEGTQRSLVLGPDQQETVQFICHLPSPVQAPSQSYAFSVAGVYPNGEAVSEASVLTILPQGYVEFSCNPLEQWLPEKPRFWWNPRVNQTQFTLTFDNRSNVPLQGRVAVEGPDRRQGARWHWVQRWRRQLLGEPIRGIGELGAAGEVGEIGEIGVSSDLSAPEDRELGDREVPALWLDPAAAALPMGATVPLTLGVRRRLPWLGWSRIQRLTVRASLVDSTLDLRHETQTLELHVLPVVPAWLQILGGLAGVLLLITLGRLLMYREHTRPVYSLQFSGRADEVISGSADQTLLRWWVKGNHLRAMGLLTKGEKAVRVVRYRPVHNDQVVAGFENGTIELYDLLTDQHRTLIDQLDDRVFDLAFSRDARTLFSAHGSGRVLQWDPDLTDDTPPQALSLGFAANALSLVGEDSHLVVGGRFNRLALVNLDTQAVQPLPYNPGGQNDFIAQLATADSQPYLLAAADSQGFVTLWNLEACQESLASCVPTDRWLAHGGAPVRTVALTEDGCYLASGGDDGDVRLWPLTAAATRQPADLQGEVVRHSRQPINAVDIIQQRRQLLIASGGDDRQVRLRRQRLPRRSPNPCGQEP